jgi:uncharacterized protein YbjT (DUF2867 family)
MKLTVIGGTGLIGSQMVQKLTAAGHEAVPAAPSCHRLCKLAERAATATSPCSGEVARALLTLRSC